MTNFPCKRLSVECTLKFLIFAFSAKDDQDYKKAATMDDNCHIINREIINH